MGKNHRFNRTYVHLVFPTHEREPTIDHAAREQFAQIISGVAVNLGAETLACGGWTEHMHGLVTPPSTLSLSDFVGRLKGNSSRLANKNDIFEAERFRWSRGYGAFSVAASDVTRAAAYIENQEIRHASQTLGDELHELAERAGISEDEANHFFTLGLAS